MSEPRNGNGAGLWWNVAFAAFVVVLFGMGYVQTKFWAERHQQAAATFAAENREQNKAIINNTQVILENQRALSEIHKILLENTKLIQDNQREIERIRKERKGK